MQRDRDAIEKALLKKGFQRASARSKSHRYYQFWHKELKTSVITHVSHGSGYSSIGDSLLTPMAQQCKLSKADFIDLVDCPLTVEKYTDRLRQQGIVPEEESSSD